MQTGILYIVATPIGNLGDITFRALEVIKKVDLIVCEDTRVTSKLLAHFEIRKPLLSFNEHSRRDKTNRVISLLLEGKSIAQVTDAGTPGVSDPGGVLVENALNSGVEVIGIPGASAVTLALSISGFPCGEFIFMGYFPKKKGRQTVLRSLVNEKKTVVFYESPYRIDKTIKDLSESLSDREIVICRELTKKFEEVYRGKLGDLIGRVKPKGEFVVVLRGVR